MCVAYWEGILLEKLLLKGGPSQKTDVRSVFNELVVRKVSFGDRIPSLVDPMGSEIPGRSDARILLEKSSVFFCRVPGSTPYSKMIHCFKRGLF